MPETLTQIPENIESKYELEKSKIKNNFINIINKKYSEIDFKSDNKRFLKILDSSISNIDPENYKKYIDELNNIESVIKEHYIKISQKEIKEKNIIDVHKKKNENKKVFDNIQDSENKNNKPKIINQIDEVIKDFTKKQIEYVESIASKYK